MMTSADMIWTAGEAVAATGGRAAGDWRAYGLSADPDAVRRGDLFVALEDGDECVSRALAAGAVAAIVPRVPEGMDDAHLLVVEDPAAALRSLALAARRRSGAKIVGVAGSAGRTATRGMLAALLEALGQTHAACGMDYAMALAGLHPGCDYGVFDAGSCSGGDEAFMMMAFPHILLTDRVGPDMFRHVSPGSTILTSRESPLFEKMKPAAAARNIRLCGYGVHDEAEACLLDWLEAANGSRVRARIWGEDISFTVPVPGRAAALRALGVLLAARLAGADLRQAVRALAALPAAACLESRERAYSGSSVMLMNTAPSSISAAFRVLALVDPGRGGRRIAVLGNMPGAGPAKMALPLAAADVQLVYTSGKNRPDSVMNDRCGAELAQIVTDVLTPGDVVMVKGSHENCMDVVVEALRALPEKFGRKKK